MQNQSRQRKTVPSARGQGRSPSAVLHIPGGSSHHVLVSTPVFWLCWWLVFGLHVATAGFCMAQAVVHLVLSLPAVHLNTSAIPVALELKRIAGCSYVVVTVLHLAAITRILRASLHCGSRRLRFPAANIRRSGRNAHPSDSKRNLLLRLRESISTILGPDGPFSIHSTLFASTLVVREAVEVLLQSYQIWSLNYSVASVWINTFAVTVVVLNCWSLPLVDRFFRGQEGRRRLMHLVVDMMLDFACAVAVPICIMVPYMLMFDWKMGEFPRALVRNDVWFTNAVSEAKQTLVTSKLDYVSSLLPQYTIFSSLRVLKRLVRRMPLRISMRSVAPRSGRQLDRTGSSRPTLLASTVRTKWERRVFHVVSPCIATWGIALMALHVQANTAKLVQNSGCQLYSRTWLARNATCSVQYINCYRLGISGSADQIGHILNQLERPVLASLAILHCPALVVPDQIVQFKRLGIVEIVNSTVLSWPTNAAIRQSTHPLFTSVGFRNSNLSHLPDAFLHRNLPIRLTHFLVFNCTLASLPDNLGELWATSGLVQLRFELNRLQTLPASLGLVRFKWLWIVGNRLESLPENLFESAQPDSIKVSGNPLTRLPSSVDTSALRELLVEHTNVSALPVWSLEWLEIRAKADAASFFGSPLCTETSSTLVAHDRVCNQDLQSQYGGFPSEVPPEKFQL